MSVATTSPIPRGLGLALAACGPVAIGGILAGSGGMLSPIAAAPAIVFGVAAATSPALYIAIATTGNAPPLTAVLRAFAIAIAAFGVALAGFVLPAAFLSLSSTSPLTTKLVCSGALAAASVLAAWRLATELAPRTVGGIVVVLAWAIATLGIGGRLWWDLASEVLP